MYVLLGDDLAGVGAGVRLGLVMGSCCWATTSAERSTSVSFWPRERVAKTGSHTRPSAG